MRTVSLTSLTKTNIYHRRILLEFGAGINTHSNEFKESALTLACYKGHLEMVRFLLEAGADQEQLTSQIPLATLISFILFPFMELN